MSELHTSRTIGYVNNQYAGSNGGKNKHKKSIEKIGTMKKETDVA